MNPALEYKPDDFRLVGVGTSLNLEQAATEYRDETQQFLEIVKGLDISVG